MSNNIVLWFFWNVDVYSFNFLIAVTINSCLSSISIQMGMGPDMQGTLISFTAKHFSLLRLRLLETFCILSQFLYLLTNKFLKNQFWLRSTSTYVKYLLMGVKQMIKWTVSFGAALEFVAPGGHSLVQSLSLSPMLGEHSSSKIMQGWDLCFILRRSQRYWMSFEQNYNKK